MLRNIEEKDVWGIKAHASHKQFRMNVYGTMVSGFAHYGDEKAVPKPFDIATE